MIHKVRPCLRAGGWAVCFLLQVVVGRAQDQNASSLYFDDILDSTIAHTRKMGVDTIVLLHEIKGLGVTIDTLRDLGPKYWYQQAYLLYRKGDSVITQRLVEYCDTDCIRFLTSVSQPLSIDDTAFFTWLQSFKKSDKTDNILPYMCRSIKNGQPIIEEYRVYDECKYGITIYAKTSDHKSYFYPYYFEQDLGHGMPNLNYTHNNRSFFGYLYFKLNGYFTPYDKNYRFAPLPSPTNPPLSPR